MLICPLTHRLLREPVILSDGHTVEREWGEAVLAAGDAVSPVTGQPPASRVLRPNRAVRELLDSLGPSSDAAAEG